MNPAPPPASLAGLPPAAPVFGLLVGGRPVQADWRQPSPDRFVTEVLSPATATELALFLLPGVVLPPGRGCLIYYAAPPFANWAVLGTLTPERPSAVVHTGWAASPDIACAPVVQVGVSLEPLEAVATAAGALASTAASDKLGFAALVARDLSAYVSSFVQTTSAGERLSLPPDAVDKWAQRLQAKLQRDPNYLLRYNTG